jgi:PTH1 family peptidyl-tRNA hydrolase
MPISLVVGLGNPGRNYAETRHNLGWIILDALAKKHGLVWQHRANFESEIARWDVSPGCTRWLVKPQTFMNDSGRAVGALARYHRFTNNSIAVVYDDINIEVGLVKVSESGSAGGTTVLPVCSSIWVKASLDTVLALARSFRRRWTSRISFWENFLQITVFF